MNHDKIIKRPDGSRVRISVTLSTGQMMGKPEWKTYVDLSKSGKRKFLSVHQETYAYRCMELRERREYEYQEYLQYVSEEEILAVKLELWENLKPVR